MPNFERFFWNLDALEEVISYAYSERSRANNKLVNKIADKLTEYKDYKEICSELDIDRAIFFYYTNSNYRREKSDHKKDKRKKDPELRRKQNENSKKYIKKRNEISITDVWTADEVKNSTELSEKEIRERGIVGSVKERMEPFIEIGIIEVRKKDGNRFYKSNPDNPFVVVMESLSESSLNPKIMKPERAERIKQYLRNAINAYNEGLALFPAQDYSETLPEEMEKKIMKYCKKCGENMEEAKKLDSEYSQVYQYYSNGGKFSECRLGKNKWCYEKIKFAEKRINEL